LETDEEENLEDILIEEDKDKDMEKEIKGVIPLTRLPTCVPPGKGKEKVPKDIDESKSVGLLGTDLGLELISQTNPYTTSAFGNSPWSAD